ncbi:MAG: F0F1 ATP synthase subunit A [Henriciella sp.]|nr:F0F1 ATP synthase subunit A [Henriciella sp.]
MTLSPDDIVFWQVGAFRLNATIIYTWVIMLTLTASAWLVGRRLTSTLTPRRVQAFAEAVMIAVERQLEDIAPTHAAKILPFVATLFILIMGSAIFSILPGGVAPTASLSTTVALAISVLLAVPLFGIRLIGVKQYFSRYIRPTPLMLPFNIISELSRTVALAIRLYGNMMSGAVLGAILLSIAPFFFPVMLQSLGLLTGIIQAYIFSILAAVYISSAVRITATTSRNGDPQNG